MGGVGLFVVSGWCGSVVVGLVAVEVGCFWFVGGVALVVMGLEGLVVVDGWCASVCT